jgi:hypothetical protein
MKHFVCTGTCEGESSRPGVCQNDGCPKEGEPLVSCDCQDGLHEDLETTVDDD